MSRLLLSIEVECTETFNVKGAEKEVVLVQFHGTAHSDDFNGNIIGTGTDTQKYCLNNGKKNLSARYILEGTDKTGCHCRLFIENELIDDKGWKPTIVTNSKYLSSWEKKELTASVDVTAKGVNVKIYEA